MGKYINLFFLLGDMNKIVFIVGMCGSGKSIVADELVKKGFGYVRFGQLTLDKVIEQRLAPTEENEKRIREELRRQYGMGAYAALNLPKFDALLLKGNVVGDGLYSWSEYKILKDHYQDKMVVLHIYAPPELRYERLEARTRIDEQMRNRPMTRKQAEARDCAEIENIEKGGPIAMANYCIQNLGGVEELREDVGRFLSSCNLLE